MPKPSPFRLLSITSGLLLLLTFSGMLSPLQHAHAAGTAYYVDCSASSNGDGSQANPWNALTSVNNAGPFQPGDQILLKRGVTCPGELAPTGSGSSSGGFITIDAYGSGDLPVIDAGTTSVAAIHTFNQSYWQVQNIETSGGSDFGICLCGGGGTALTSLHAVNVVVHDAHGGNTNYAALLIGDAENQSSPPIVTDALVNEATVYNITNNEKGIMLRIGTAPGDGDVNQLGSGTIENSTVHGIGWDGIGLLFAKNSQVQNNVVYDTGTNSNGGGNGIFTWGCNACLVQNNEVYNAHSPYGADGGGIDIDGYGTTNSIVQYNYVHDNDGPCLLHYSAEGQTNSNNVFRYNVCANNGRASDLSTFGDVLLSNCTCGTDSGGETNGISIYNNSFYWNPAVIHSLIDAGSALWAADQTNPDIFDNNLIYGSASTGTDFAYTPPGTPLTLDYNLYWTASSSAPRWFVQNACNPCTSFSAYQSATGQDAHGQYVDPLLKNPTYDSVGRPEAAFRLLSGSPALGAGTAIGNMGSQDFFGNALGSTHNIGADEGSGLSNPNLVQNPGFEADGAAVQSPQDWTTWPGSDGSNASASYTEAGGHTGSWRLAHWRPDKAYEVSTYQNIPNIPNGTYIATAWVQAYPNGNSTQLFIVRTQAGGTILGQVSLPDSPTTWVQVTINNIQVTGGQAEVEFYSNATANASIRADDVSFELAN